MKFLIPLLVLCAAFFVVSDAAPVPPSGFKLEAASAQWDDWGSTFLSRMFTPAATRDGTAAAHDGTAASRDGIKTLLGTLLTKSTDNGETYVQSDSDKKLLGQTILKEIRKLFSSGNTDPDDEVSRSFFDGIDSILSVIEKRLDEGSAVSDNEIMRTMFDAMDNMLSAKGRSADPSDEITHSWINGFKTLFPFLIPNELNRGVIQSSDGKTKQALYMNFLSKIQSDISDDEAGRTAINIAKKILSVTRRNNPKPNNEFAKALLDAADAWFSVIGKVNENNRPTDKEITNEVLSHFNNIFSGWVKGVENRRIKSPDCAGDSEAKTQQWGAILGSLATGVLKNYLDG
jgi:hypothetical protein